MKTTLVAIIFLTLAGAGYMAFFVGKDPRVVVGTRSASGASPQQLVEQQNQSAMEGEARSAVEVESGGPGEREVDRDPRGNPAATAHRQAVSNMTQGGVESFDYHQEKVRESLPYFTGQKTFDEEFRYGRRARILATYSAMIIMLAEGEAIPAEVYNALSREDQIELNKNALFVMSNAGLEFIITRGRFPVLDKVVDLNKKYPISVPLDEIPYNELVSFASLAQSYRLSR